MTNVTYDTRTVIETPENVLLTFSIAGPGSRMGAFFIDLVIRWVVALGAIWGMSYVFPLIGRETSGGMILLGIFLMEWGYSTLFEGLWRGQTPGKRWCNLRVIKDAGYPISFYDAVLRNLLRAADILPFGYGVGLICMAATKKLQRIGDMAAGTIVVRNEHSRFNRQTASFEQLEPLTRQECPGRFFVSERTLDVIEQLLARRDKLPRRRVEEIARILSDPVARQLGYQIDRESGSAPDILFLRRVLRTFSTTIQGVS